jgi:aspartate oxidase
MISVAGLVIDCALQRKESRGLHYVLDHVDKHDEAINTIARRF